MFHSARIKLTAWYLAVIMLISFTFSVAIYKVLTEEIDRFERAQRFKIERSLIEGNLLPIETRLHLAPKSMLFHPELVEEVRQRILTVLALLNGLIFLLSGAFGYVLAGRTLAPIKNMVDEQHRFISDASHELKTPLTSLKSAFEVFLRNHKPTLAEAKTIMVESIAEVNALQSLSESLLTLVQYQIPNGNTTFGLVALDKVIAEAVRKIDPIAREKQIVIDKKASEITLWGNKQSLVDLVVILLDNAVKYSNHGDRVEVILEKSDPTIYIRVTDHGIGISHKDLPHIFDRFYRSDSARGKTERSGYGLGLSIAQKIVDLHHGSLTVKSKVNHGASFVVKLPEKQSKPHAPKVEIS